MLAPRLIPVLLFKNGVLVRSQNFDFYQSTGDPITQVQRFTSWRSDELIYLDITEDNLYSSNETMYVIGSATSKKDQQVTFSRNFIDVIKEVSKCCFVPLTAGGNIRNIEKVRALIKGGADKVAINTAAIERPEFISEIVREFGSQALVVSIDYISKDGKREVYSHGGSVPQDLDPIFWAKSVEELGAGEILLNSIDRDGMGVGYDIDYLRLAASQINIPLIALGGAGEYEHFCQVLEVGVSAVAAANIFHFREQSIVEAKKHIKSRGFRVRN